MRKFCLVSLVLSLSLLSAGCPKDPYRAAVQGSDDVSLGVAAAIHITTQYYNAKTINDSQKAVVGGFLNTVTDCNTKFRSSVVSLHKIGRSGAADILPIADSFVQCVEAQRSVMSDLKVYNILKSVDAAINGIELAIASAKGVK